MNRLVKTFAVLFALIAVTAADGANETRTAADELSKEEIYNINADMYCQTELAINEKLLDIENPVNTYTSLLGDDIKDIDCEAVLREYVIRTHNRLRKDFRAKGAETKTLNCFMHRIVILGYDKMRMKFNALYGIEVEKEKKDELRKSIDKEIGDAIDIAVNECWPETDSSNVTKPAESENAL